MDVHPAADHCVEVHSVDSYCTDPRAWLVVGGCYSSLDPIVTRRAQEETDGAILDYVWVPGQPVSVTRRTAR